jgi:hypothetical protein
VGVVENALLVISNLTWLDLTKKIRFRPLIQLCWAISHLGQVKLLITSNSFCVVQRATAQSKTGFFRDWGVAEAPPGFQAGCSDCSYFSLFLFILFAHLKSLKRVPTLIMGILPHPRTTYPLNSTFYLLQGGYPQPRLLCFLDVISRYRERNSDRDSLPAEINSKSYSVALRPCPKGYLLYQMISRAELTSHLNYHFLVPTNFYTCLNSMISKKG